VLDAAPFLSGRDDARFLGAISLAFPDEVADHDQSGCNPDAAGERPARLAS